MEDSLGLGVSHGDFWNDGMSSETSYSVSLGNAVFNNAYHLEQTSDDDM